ncbi:MAG: peptide ABC transporter substrate-binding protein, partial [Dehalococcoidia bacterium]|nr:peptide ABC transporter substrate-binding protein [Dehalococcoidia bacterium]
MVAPKKLLALSSAVLAAVVVASCAPAAPAPQGQTGGQQPAQQQGQPRRGGAVRIALSQEPATLNPLLNNQTVVALSARFVFEPLAQYGVDGNLEPVLAAEIPSPQNGGVRTEGNGMVVTWRLKPNLRWADGSPVTSNDIRFTWRVYMNPANAAVNRTGYPDIESIETPDPLTAVIRYRTIYAPFREHFPFLLPAAGFNNNDDVSQSPFNRQPWGTGPFRVRSFTPADNITFERNPNYREEGKPYLDTIIVRILPSVEAALQAFRVGDVDVMWNLPIPSIPEIQTIPGVSLPTQPNFQRVERLMLNLSCPSGPQQGQPTCPHPILGDARVREALDYAIDRRTLNERLLSGRGAPVASNVQSQIPPTPFDPARSRQLLDQAGWT